jgi:hypothetical protein
MVGGGLGTRRPDNTINLLGSIQYYRIYPHPHLLAANISSMYSWLCDYHIATHCYPLLPIATL